MKFRDMLKLNEAANNKDEIWAKIVKEFDGWKSDGMGTHAKATQDGVVYYFKALSDSSEFAEAVEEILSKMPGFNGSKQKIDRYTVNIKTQISIASVVLAYSSNDEMSWCTVTVK